MYTAVLSTALIVSLLGISGLIAVRLERAKHSVGDDRAVARFNANSAVELALKAIENDANWRTSHTSGVETTPQKLGTDARGTLSWILEDSDGSLTDADTELRIRGIGRVGDTVQVSSVELQYNGALSCLKTAICSGDMTRFYPDSTTTADSEIASSLTMQSDFGSTINADVEAVGAITGSGYTGTTTSPAPARDLPSPTVFDYYTTAGTAINYASLPTDGTFRVLTDVVLSPTNNPFGAVNAAGIYVIDCGGGRLRIEWSRINATLVILNPHRTSRVANSVSWEPSTPGFPALLIDGQRFRLETSANDLDEAARRVNFNPAGSPYLGVSDSDQTDTYPSLIRGIIYSTDEIRVTGNATVIGTVIAAGIFEVRRNDSFNVTYDANNYSSPPPGFGSASSVSVEPGSWLWDVAP